MCDFKIIMGKKLLKNILLFAFVVFTQQYSPNFVVQLLIKKNMYVFMILYSQFFFNFRYEIGKNKPICKFRYFLFLYLEFGIIML